MKKTRRTSKVGDLVRDVLAEAIRRDENIQREIGQPAGMLVSITGVDVSTDLRFARVHISTMGDEAESERILTILRKHKTKLRGALAAGAKLRVTPELDLRADRTLAHAGTIEELLAEARRRDAEIVPDETGDGDDRSEEGR
jgi:ribosome-binding factor A